VLGTLALGEADTLVTLLAESTGRVRGVAPAARKSRRRFGGALEPMTRVRASWSEREGRELHRIEALELERSYAAMQADPERQAACAVLAEIAVSVTPEGQADPKGFRLLGAVLDALESGLDAWIAVRYYEFWTLRLHGVLADLNACDACGTPFGEHARRHATGGGGLRCAGCVKEHGGAHRLLSAADLDFLRAAAGRPPSEVRAPARAIRPGGALDLLLRGTLEGFLEKRLRAYRHLAAMSSSAVGKSGP
jgi:DNA repair protein RecO (recombination protein O)